MRRAWTELSDDSTKVLDVKDGTLIYSSDNKIRAIKTATGAKIWSKDFKGQSPTHLCINGSTIFYDLYAGEGIPERIYAIDRKTGASTEFGLPFLGKESRSLTCDDKRLYLLENGVVKGVEIATKKLVWQTDLKKDAKGKMGWLSCLVAGKGMVFVGIDKLGLHSIDATTGKVYWRENAEYGIYDAPLILSKGVLTGFKGIRLQDFKTGKPIWTSKLTNFEPSNLEGSTLLGVAEARPCALDITNGKVLWEWKEPAKGYSHGANLTEAMMFGPSSGAVSTYNWREEEGKSVIRLVGKSGQQVWSAPLFCDGSPVYVDANVLICNDNERLIGYTNGARPPVPSDEAGQRTMAMQMSKEFELFDRVDWNRFAEIGKYASKELIDQYTRWALESRESGPADKAGHGLRFYTLLMEVPPILSKICGPDDTTSLLAAINKLDEKNTYRSYLTAILGKTGDANRSIPLFIERLKANRGRARSESNDQETLTAVAESTSPIAVKFMIQALDDLKAPSEWRYEAFSHLAATGGAEGVAAVNRARAKSGPRPTWQAEFAAGFRKQEVLSELKDAKGRTWRLVKSGVLGNYGDLFIQQKTATGWANPIFCNFSLERTFAQQAPKTYKGINVNKLIESEWVKVLPDDPALLKDSDKDGLSDLVEARLGTDPNKADTDGDGLIDSVDPCPTAAPRPLGDREKVIAACVEAYFFDRGYRNPPANIHVEGMKPFELYGYPAPLIWPINVKGQGLGGSYGAGMNSIGFHAPMKDFHEDTKGKDIIQFSKDGMSAETMISRYSGGLNGEGVSVKLKKVGDDWFVIGFKTRFVS